MPVIKPSLSRESSEREPGTTLLAQSMGLYPPVVIPSSNPPQSRVSATGTFRNSISPSTGVSRRSTATNEVHFETSP